MNLNQVTLVCTDYTASVEFYNTPGLTQIVDSPPRYARFDRLCIYNAGENRRFPPWRIAPE